MATAATLDALGLTGCTIRLNDRRLLVSALTILGFPPQAHDAVLITLDKLDKIGEAGVISELRDRAFPAGPVEALETFLGRESVTDAAFSEDAIHAALPDGVDPVAVSELAAIGLAVEQARGSGTSLIEFDPWLVRGMGYYTGAIFEVAHPSLGYSLGGGGRYDGMIGRFLGSDVPAVGFSLGFERLVDLVDLDAGSGADAVALIHDPDASPAALVSLQSELIAQGKRVRLERRPRNLKPLLEQLAEAGFGEYALVEPIGETAPEASALEFRPLTSR